MASLVANLLFTGVAFLFALFGLGIFKFGRMLSADVRAMAAAERTPVGGLSAGETAEVRGTIRPAEEGTVETALYGREAVEFETRVERSTDGGGTSRSWSTYHEDGASLPFRVEDETGSVRIEPPEELEPAMAMEWERFGAGADGDLSPAARSYLSGVEAADLDDGIDVGPLSLGSRQRCGEGALEPGDDVHVYGEVVEVDHGWGETSLVLTGDRESGFVYSTVDQADLERTTSALALAVSAFGLLWALVTLVAGLLPWVTG